MNLKEQNGIIFVGYSILMVQWLLCLFEQKKKKNGLPSFESKAKKELSRGYETRQKAISYTCS